MIIGIMGKSGAGKNVVGDYLCAVLGGAQVAFADAIKDGVAEMLDVTPGQVEKFKNESLTVRSDTGWVFDLDMRHVIQYYGMQMRKANDAYWRRILFEKIDQLKREGFENIIVTDVRFEAEIQLLQQMDVNTLLFHVLRDDCNDYNHVTEHLDTNSWLFPRECTWAIDNNGTIENTHWQINKILKQEGLI